MSNYDWLKDFRKPIEKYGMHLENAGFRKAGRDEFRQDYEDENILIQFYVERYDEILNVTIDFKNMLSSGEKDTFALWIIMNVISPRKFRFPSGSVEKNDLLVKQYVEFILNNRSVFGKSFPYLEQYQKENELSLEEFESIISGKKKI